MPDCTPACLLFASDAKCGLNLGQKHAIFSHSIIINILCRYEVGHEHWLPLAIVDGYEAIDMMARSCRERVMTVIVKNVVAELLTSLLCLSCYFVLPFVAA